MGERIGKLIVSEDLLLRMFDFYPGKIRRINLGAYNEIELVIEHPDMPEVEEGDHIPLVTPTYITYKDALGHQVSLRKVGG